MYQKSIYIELIYIYSYIYIWKTDENDKYIENLVGARI